MTLSVNTCLSARHGLPHLLALTEAHGDPLCQDWVVCPHPLMSRWVSQRVAARRGLRAQLELKSTSTLYHAVHLAAWGRPPAQPSRAQLTWAALGAAAEVAERDPRAASLRRSFPRLKPSGEGAPVPGRRYLAAQSLAEGARRLLALRPAWLARWSEGGDEVPEGAAPWWPPFWRALKARLASAAEREGLDEGHLAATCAELAAHPSRLRARVRRVIFFGHHRYDAATLTLASALAGLLEVHFISLDPALATPEALAALRAPEAGGAEGALSPRLSSPLPQAVGAGWSAHLDRAGRAARAALSCPPALPAPSPALLPSPPRPLWSPEGAQGEGEARPAPPSLLERLQGAVARGEPLPARPAPHPAGDRSVQLHSCHSELRQVEALYQALSASFRRDPALRPRDALVLCADVERFVPLIEAVFNGEGGRLGAEISRPHGLNPFTDLLTQLMSITLGRAYRYDVFQLLKLPLVSARFRLALADILALEAWLKDSGVRWGFDAAHRARVGLTDDELNTWRFGLDRLLMGALVGDDAGIFEGVSPSPVGESDTLLVRFLDFYVVLRECVERLREPQPPRDWARALVDAARCLSRPDASTRWLFQELEADLYHTFGGGAGAQLVSPQAVARALEGGVGRKPTLTGDGRDLVRFYPLDQAHGVPAALVCLLDMSEGRFPSAEPAAHADPVDLAPSPVDRHPTLEQLAQLGVSALAAERALLVFYTGRTPAGEPLSPAPAITALLDELRGRFAVEAQEDLVEALTTRHPLHPFSPQSFEGDEDGNPTEDTLSHDPLWLESARVWRAAQTNPVARPPFAEEGVEEPARAFRRPRVDTIQQCLKNPAEFFLRRGVGLSLVKDEVVSRERELLELDGLQAWGLKSRALELAHHLEEDGRDPREHVEYVFERVRAEGLLPVGKMGLVSFEQSFEEICALMARFREHREGRSKTPMSFGLTLPSGRPLRVEGEGLYEDKLIFTTPSRALRLDGFRGERLLGPWLYHVALSASERPYSGAALVAPDGEYRRFPALAPPAARELLDGWLTGLEAGLRRPLRFDPDLSWRFLEARAQGAPLEALNKAWPEARVSKDIYARRAFDGRVIWGDEGEIHPEFERAAELFLGPLYAAVAQGAGAQGAGAGAGAAEGERP